MNTKTSKTHCVGFDLGGTKMFAKVFDEQFETLGKKRGKTNAQEGEEAGMAQIIRFIDAALNEAAIDRESLISIGMGSPGTLHLNRGELLDAPNLGWKNIRIKKILEKEFGCPVTLANDVDAGLFGEYRFGAAKGSRCAFGVFPGTGIGGACVYEGNIIRGKKHSCMEIGHVQVVPDGPICGCGKQGCLEVLASRLAISAAAAQAVYRGQAPYLAKTTGTNLAEIRSGALAASVENGDKAVDQILRDAARHLGTAVANVVHLLSPDTVVLGGGLVEAMPNLFVTEVRDSANQRVMSSFVNTFEVVAAKLGDDATVLGAAAWAKESAQL